MKTFVIERHCGTLRDRRCVGVFDFHFDTGHFVLCQTYDGHCIIFHEFRSFYNPKGVCILQFKSNIWQIYFIGPLLD